MRSSRLVAILSVMLGLCQAAAADPGCQRTKFNFGPNKEDVSSTWRVLKNANCGVLVSPTFESTRFAGWRILTHPRHGIAGVQIAGNVNARIFAYQPSKGYLGQDNFVVTFIVSESGRPDYAVTVVVDVNVAESL